MDENKFFKWVWRFNGLVIALLVAASFAILVKEVLPSRNNIVTSDVVNIDEVDDSLVEVNRIEFGDIVSGYNLLKFDLVKSQAYDQGSYSKKTYGNMINTGFYNLDTNETQWVFPDNKKLIISSTIIDYPIVNETIGKLTKSITQGYVLTTVGKDTSEDGRLSSNDLKTVWYATYDGKVVKKLFENLKLENDIKVIRLSDKKLLLSFSDKIIKFDINNMQLGAVKKIEIPKNTP